jgi:pimeloyl-ACP methyl ester carboxylesterase
MHVHEWGRRDDVPLLAAGTELREVAPAIADAGFHVLAVDGRRSGRLESLVELLHDLVDERDLERPALMGHSWGAAIVVRYAVAYPQDLRALVLLGSGHADHGDLSVVDEHDIPTLLLPTTGPPRAQLGDQIAVWLVEQGL